MIRGARILVLGFGNMGQALVKGFIENGIQASRIHVVDPSENAAKLAKSMGLDYSECAEGITHPPAMVLLAVKPQIMAEAIQGVKHLASETVCFLSIAAGLNLKTLKSLLGEEARIVRAMPNTPSAIGEGMTVMAHTGNLAFEQMALADTLMDCVGESEWVEDEALMDAVTAVSGSGPAYVFLLMEAMMKAGIENGLPEKLALKLAVQTCKGAAALATQSGETPDVLRQNVTSKGGTTEAALNTLYAEKFPEAVAKAIKNATQRSLELSK